MKTKHIFGTILMATFAVACSNEDLQLVENPTQVGERIELGDVTLSLGEAESRFVVGDNFNDLNAELKDKVGAALIDTYKPTEWDAEKGKYVAVANSDKDAKYMYPLTNYISTNYAFEYDGSVWTTPAKMVEGNYMFYAPYNAKHATRKPIVAKLDAVQQLVATTNGVDKLSAIKQMVASGNVMAVSHEFIGASDEANVETSLVPIYAYPLISITNKYKKTINDEPTAMDVVIDQVVIRKATGEFTIEAPFNHYTKEGTAIKAEGGFIEGLRDFTYWKDANNTNVALKGDFAKHVGAYAYTSELLGTATKTSSAIVVKAPENGLKLAKNGGSVTFYAVIPAEIYGDEGLLIDVYTDKGVFTHTVSKPNISAGKRYPVIEYEAPKYETLITPSETGDASAGDQFSVTLSGSVTEATLVTTTADLVTLIQEADDVDEEGEIKPLSVNTLTKDVKITANVMNAIKEKSKGWKVIFNTPVTIATNLNSSNKFIVFEDEAEITEGTIGLNKNVTFNDKLVVKGGTVTFDAVTNSSIVNKGGTLTLNKAAVVDNQSGELIIAANVAIEASNNGGTISFVGGADYYNQTNYQNVTITNNKGKVTVPVYTNVKTNSEIVNGDAATGAATLDVNGVVTNISSNASDGTINVYGTATVDTNNGLVVMGGSSATANVDTNNNYINNTKNGTVNTTSKEGNIYYEFTEDVDGKLIAKASIYNMIVLNGMTWSPEANQTISANIELRDATIAVWDSEIVITIDGALTSNDPNIYNSIYATVEGVEGAQVIANTLDEDIVNKQKIAKKK